jgi:DNA-binding PadR family transcriptional regulator
MYILRALASGPRYGQQLVDESGGTLKRGTVYVTLNRMEEKGFIESSQEPRPRGEGGLPRRKYSIASEGRRVMNVIERMEAWASGGEPV